MSLGAFATIFGFGLYSQASAACRRFSNSRTEVWYFVHAGLVGFGKRAIQAVRLIADEIEHATPLPQGIHIGFHLFRIALVKKFFKQFTRAAFRRDRSTATGVAERRALIRHCEDQRRVTRLVADLFSGMLVERHPVTKATPLGMWRAGDKTPFGRMPARWQTPLPRWRSQPRQPQRRKNETAS